jgi:hypothetical protein
MALLARALPGSILLCERDEGGASPLAVLRLLRTTAGDRSRGGWSPPGSATAPASIPPAAGSALPDRRRPLVMCRLYEKSAVPS